MRGKPQREFVDRAIGRLAEAQHGVVTRAQLSELGLGSRAIDYRLERGLLRPVHRGVYTIGHGLLSQHGRWMAAVLACGPEAVLSHRAAAALWLIRRGAAIEVTVPGPRHGREGIRLHRAVLPGDETTTHHGIRTTTVPRTLLDLAAVVQRHELRSALRQAEQLRLTDPLKLGDLVARHPHRRGIASARWVLEQLALGFGIVRSELEERFQAFLLKAGLPLPITNVRIEGIEVDCVWSAQRLIVELDGRSVHEAADAFETDRARDRRLAAAGWRVVRITWRQLHESPGEVQADLRRLLGLDG
jgi:REase_MTES_1575/Transcriptional regulator, AbiEi antitoxin